MKNLPNLQIVRTLMSTSGWGDKSGLSSCYGADGNGEHSDSFLSNSMRKVTMESSRSPSEGSNCLSPRRCSDSSIHHNIPVQLLLLFFFRLCHVHLIIFITILASTPRTALAPKLRGAPTGSRPDVLLLLFLNHECSPIASAKPVSSPLRWLLLLLLLLMGSTLVGCHWMCSCGCCWYNRSTCCGRASGSSSSSICCAAWCGVERWRGRWEGEQGAPLPHGL
mmetsp:Transcript_27051/g.69699  ORF Transcript_27051/g.69699 Transcript_27051/m.69699 type:complete len:222 (+) Transcript_27051:2883-3548(+)